MQTDAKALKRDLRAAKVDHTIAQAKACVGGGQAAFWAAVKELKGPETRARPVPSLNFRDDAGNLSTTPAEAAASATAHFTKVYNIDRDRPVGSAAAVASVRQRRVFKELDNPISERELHFVLDKAKSGKSTSNQIPVELFQACREDPVAFGHLLQLVGDVFESGRPSNGLADSDSQPVPPPPQPPPLRRARAPPPALDLSVSNARKFNWTVAWQRDNPKQEGSDSRDRYAAYCAATTLADARIRGARAADILHDYAKGYLRILPNSLSNDEAAATTPLAPDTVACMLKEWVTMRLKMLPKKGDLHDLNNWRGIMLLDAASKLVSMIIANRLDRVLKEEGLEAQNGFTGGRGCSDGSFSLRQALKRRREHGLESWVLFVDLVKAFDSVPRDVLWAVLAKFGIPPHLLGVIKRMHEGLLVSFEIGGEKVEVPNTAGVKQGDNMAPLLFIFVMQACLETLGDTWPVGKLEFRTNTRTTGVNGGKVSGTDWTNKGEFSFEIWCSLYADDAGVMHSSRADLVAGAEAIDAHLKLFGLLMHVGRGGKRSKTEAVLFHKRHSRQEDGDTSDITLPCGGTISFTPQFTYLGSMIHCSLSDSHDVANRIRKASAAFGALRETIFGTKYVPLQAKAALYSSGVLSVLLYGCESWCLTQKGMLTPLRNWHNKRIREMCRVTMHQVELYSITSVELQKRIGIWDLDYYVGRRTLQWVGHVARMDKSRLPRRLLTAWVREPRPEFGQEMSYGRSLERWLKLFGLPLRYTEWATLAQDRAEWARLITRKRPQ